MSEKCRSCEASIVWTVTSNGGSMPLDALPVADGNVIIDGEARAQNGDTRPRALVLAGSDVPFGDPPRYVSHFSTCPHAAAWRTR